MFPTDIALSSEQLSLIGELDKIAKRLVRRDFELSLANEQLREVDQLKSEFISVAAHQLRTPLSGVKWTLEMFLRGELGPVTPEQKELIQKSYESNNRMIKLVNDLLSVEQIESGRWLFNFAPVNLLEILDTAMSEISSQAAQKGIKISFVNRPAAIPPVSADKEKIQLVFQNLLENAVDYTPPGGSIKIEMESLTTELRFKFADTGIGIPKEQQEHIFKRFFRTRNALKVKTNGSGLGLFIAKYVLEKHHGTIWFESEEGKGATFYIVIPVI